MNELVPVVPAEPVSPLRQRLIDDMNMRHFSRETQRNYVRDVGRFATFLGRPPDTATAEDLRRFRHDAVELLGRDRLEMMLAGEQPAIAVHHALFAP